MRTATPHDMAVAARIDAGVHYRNPASRRHGPMVLLDGLAPMPQDDDGSEDAVRTRLYRFAFSRCWFELSRPVVE